VYVYQVGNSTLFWHETLISKTLLFTQETSTFNIAEIPADKSCLRRGTRGRLMWQWRGARWGRGRRQRPWWGGASPCCGCATMAAFFLSPSTVTIGARRRRASRRRPTWPRLAAARLTGLVVPLPCDASIVASPCPSSAATAQLSYVLTMARLVGRRPGACDGRPRRSAWGRGRGRRRESVAAEKP
jgi:hypothetical protein